ncbi:MAG: hypothetical protein A2086_14210 [Spirochaetes bacterium GWD1_27_9]|nr:MAG: hypothetical protein A2Z98_09310 [Spirochaetes bacterium GWB1_27_13]OHD23679.1 MAG: hypothetical protein A2Y34_15450 [Spirochaetes bacterium GWC1_27_15]OHD29878.1 MAG: hypothetical protein A2086_14210 [Spirochaetes bacterium GWD1_27_9]
MHNKILYNLGFEYGIKQKVMYIGNMDFIEYFDKANCFAICYFFDRFTNLPEQICFAFEHEENSNKLFECFIDWINKSNSNSDAVSIDFIEENTGGYTVCFYQNESLFIERMIPKYLKDWVEPIVLNCIKFKHFDKISNYYKLFKEKSKNKKIKVGVAIGVNGTIKKIIDISFYKDKFNFYDENNIPRNSVLISFKNKDEIKDIQRKKIEMPKNTLLEIEKKRDEGLKYFYPISYEQIIENGWLRGIICKLEEKYKKSQIVQSICNIILFERLKKDNKLDIIFEDSKNYQIKILEYLLNNYESFSSYYPSDNFFSELIIKRQIEYDLTELDKYLYEEN